MATFVLGIDTATDDAAVAVAGPGGETLERRVEPRDGGRPRHAEGLLAAVEELVAEAGGWDAIGTVAVGVGPGSFTGLRIGVATARALAQARDLPIVPVSSLAALAERASERPDAAGRPIAAMIDARRGETFFALRDAAGITGEPVVTPPEELGALLARAAGGPLAVGSGALRFREWTEAAGADVPADSEPEHRASGAAIIRLAAGAPGVDVTAVEPLYLRRPDAELWRERDRDRRTERARR
ncbi:tRNA (adenosine(37)-N6)-threonylcarbamoyltransferase complex dimerization subunit type 1 TsaB [Thermoleophilia bacterium SCSIO 60948]|nr:tRNA (adenosine(37)-N6)-threonylcarbamoyltransferase complex dimerization subunit type 1 TsaB [Thermoleophilia bacterium SCSIO 60948]